MKCITTINPDSYPLSPILGDPYPFLRGVTDGTVGNMTLANNDG